MRKWSYLGHFNPKLQNKDTLFSPTFKVGESKMVLFLSSVSGASLYTFVGWWFNLSKNAKREKEKKMGNSAYACKHKMF